MMRITNRGFFSLQSWIYLAFFFGLSVYKAFWTFLFEVSLTNRLLKNWSWFYKKKLLIYGFWKENTILGPTKRLIEIDFKLQTILTVTLAFELSLPTLLNMYAITTISLNTPFKNAHRISFLRKPSSSFVFFCERMDSRSFRDPGFEPSFPF